MKAIVCVKQVPDTSGKVAVNPDGTLNRASMQTITNPDGTVRVSVRTTKEMDAAAICKKVGGGGHVRAAGASFTCGMAEAKAAMLKAAEEQFHAAK